MCSNESIRVKKKGSLRPTCLAEGPWTNLQIDYIGPLPAAKGGYRYILVVVDTFSKWTEAFPIKADTASATARVLWEHIFCRFGLPRRSLSLKFYRYMPKVTFSGPRNTSLLVPHSTGMARFCSWTNKDSKLL